MVKAIDNKTGREAISRSLPPYNDLNDFEFVYKVASAIESLVASQAVNKDELKVGDRVYLHDSFDKVCVFPYDDSFVNDLPVSTFDKIRYCYSISNPPLNSKYIVLAIKDNKAYIQTAVGGFRCYVVATKILKKVNE
jgi:hypothetical protein